MSLNERLGIETNSTVSVTTNSSIQMKLVKNFYNAKTYHDVLTMSCNQPLVYSTHLNSMYNVNVIGRGQRLVQINAFVRRCLMTLG